MSGIMTRDELQRALNRFPSVDQGHLPTPVEPLPRLGADLDCELFVKRDDQTGIAFGGNKVRQLNYYLGAAQAAGADTVLITGARQSNFVRTTAAMANRLGLECHIQLEDRVPGMDAPYRANGNVLLDRLLGATLHSFPEGENEPAADAALTEIAGGLRDRGRVPFIIPLSADKPPTGALGYVAAALELASQTDGAPFDEIFIASGSALTHVGLLFGLRAIGDNTPVQGVCVRRDRVAQTARVTQRLQDLAGLMGIENPVAAPDIRLMDDTLAPGYGRLSPAIEGALMGAARLEGLILDPVYTAKVLAGLIHRARDGALSGRRILFWHTGGQPALFGYAGALFPEG